MLGCYKKIVASFFVCLILMMCFYQKSNAGLLGKGFGGWLTQADETYLTVLSSAEAIWEADYGTTVEVGVQYWVDQVSGIVQDKLNTDNQPTLTTAASFNNQPVLDFDQTTYSQAMDSWTQLPDVTGNNQMTIFMVVEHDSPSTTATLAEVSNGKIANNICNITAVSSGTIRGRCKNSANAWISANWTTSTNFTATALTMIYDGTGGAGNIKLYNCNTEVASATDATGGFYTSSDSSWTMEAANSTYQADGKVAAYIIDNEAWTTDQLAEVVAISQLKYGVCN